MKVVITELQKLAPKLKKYEPAILAQLLTDLGFETTLLAGEKPVLEVETPPNRGDVLSHWGLARVILTSFHKNEKSAPDFLAPIQSSLMEKLHLFEDLEFDYPAKFCSQFHGIVLENIKIGPSPQWLQEILYLMGLRPINNVVDLTNYLAELYGQPLHAFDLDSIIGAKIKLREAGSQATITTLDDVERRLYPNTLIAQDQQGPIDLVGIMGGKESAVSTKTTRIFVQSAIFDASSIKKTARTMNLITNAALRYERGIDPTLSPFVLQEFWRLISKNEFNGARAVGKVDLRTAKPQKIKIKYDGQRINKILGTNIKLAEQLRIMQLIGCQISHDNSYIVPPVWRTDLQLIEDLAEEIIRIQGIKTLPAKKLPQIKINRGSTSWWDWLQGLSDRLAELGLNEVQTYSFISRKDLQNFELPNVGELANPLNPEIKFLRPTLAPGLLKTIASNPTFDPLAIYEIGHSFTKTAEKQSLAIGLAGRAAQAKLWLRRLADAIGMDSGLLEKKTKFWHIDQRLKDLYKIRRPVEIMEIDIDALQTARSILRNYWIPVQFGKYRPISKFPPVTRDISILVDKNLDWATLRQFIESFHSSLENTQLLDEFYSPKFKTNKKSLTFRVWWASLEKTLEDDEVAILHSELEKALVEAFNAQIR